MTRSTVICEAIGDTLEDAVRAAHAKIPHTTGTDYTLSRAVEWGFQYGGFTLTQKFWVKLIEEYGPFKT